MSEFVVKAGTFIDGTGAEPKKDVAVFVKDGKVEKLGTYADIPSGAKTYDYSNKTVMPGLINCHVHIDMVAEGDPMAIGARATKVDKVISMMKNMEETLQSGVTTVRSLGSGDGYDIEMRNAVNRGDWVGPTILAAGKNLCMTGGHGWSMAYEVDSPAEARKAARDTLKKGADVVKIMATGGVMTPGIEPGSPQMTTEEMAAAVEEAHKAGKKTATHAQGTQGIKNALDAGLDTIEHGIFLDDETIQQMKDQGTYLVATLIAPIAIIEAGVEKGVPDYAVRKSIYCKEAHEQSFRNAYKAGVKIATGTDSGTPFNSHAKIYRELELMNDFGMSPMEVVVASTKTAAEACDIAENYGTLEAGKMADMIVLNENPVDNIQTFRDVQDVFKHGEKVK